MVILLLDGGNVNFYLAQDCIPTRGILIQPDFTIVFSWLLSASQPGCPDPKQPALALPAGGKVILGTGHRCHLRAARALALGMHLGLQPWTQKASQSEAILHFTLSTHSL